jgi:hypothetical protein
MRVNRVAVTLLTVLAGVAVVGGSAVGLANADSEPAWIEAKPAGTITTAEGTFPHATLDLSIFPNTSADYPGPAGGINSLIENNGVIQSEGWPFYWPSTSLRLPANTVITVTLQQYDGSSTVWNPFWAKVHGTVDGTALYNGKALKEIDPKDVAHTFTIHQYPQAGQETLFVSVPMLAVPNNAKNLANGYPKPNTIQFSFKTKGPGTYIWNCEDPCGDSYQEFGGVMQARGWMSGKIEVVA